MTPERKEELKGRVDTALTNNRMDLIESFAGECGIKSTFRDADPAWKELYDYTTGKVRERHEQNQALLKRFKVQVDLDRLKEIPEECHSIKCFNSAGMLWEKLFKYEDGHYRSKTCASGVFVDWTKHDTREDAERELIGCIETILRVREDETW